MEQFDKISIAEISKKDMLMILEALDYAGNHTNVQAFLDLKNGIVRELSELSDSDEDEFIKYLSE